MKYIPYGITVNGTSYEIKFYYFIIKYYPVSHRLVFVETNFLYRDIKLNEAKSGCLILKEKDRLE